LCGYLDGELDAVTRRSLEDHVLACETCRREYDVMKRLVIGTSAALAQDEPPEEVWDDFLGTVYNRLERKTGWAVLITGLMLLTVYGVGLYFLLPWADPLTKFLLSLPVGGLAILFSSIWRQRLLVAKTDRYSKEVMR
jgi:predicted anti-sigma-YlaC factor YlaD